jgi:hypothetical protein
MNEQDDLLLIFVLKKRLYTTATIRFKRLMLTSARPESLK